MKKIFFTLISIVAIGFFIPFFSFAEIHIPFSNSDAGLELVRKTDDAIIAQAPDRGAAAIVEIITTVFYYMKIFLGIFAVIWIVYAGFYAVTTSGDGEKGLETSKKMITFMILGLSLMLLIEPFILDIVYGGGSGGLSYNDTSFNNLIQATKNLRIQVDGILLFLKTLLIFVAMAYIIYGGTKMMFSAGESESVESAKGMFFPIIFGIFIILFNEILIDKVLYDIVFDGEKVVFSPDSSNAIEFVRQLVGILQYFLQFVALLLFIYFIYGGWLYISSLGDSSAGENAKKIFTNSMIGMLIIIFSYVLMWSLINLDI